MKAKERNEKIQKTAQRHVDAVNEGTLLIQSIYSAFLVALAVGFAIVYGTTHRALFLDEMVSVTLGQSVSIRTSTFFVLFPITILFLHFQLLWQLRFASLKMRRTVSWMNQRGVDVKAAEFRSRIKSLVFNHLMLDTGVPSAIAALLTFLIVAVLPMAVLVFLQFRFLPYHHELITWLHRTVLVLDTVLVLSIWPQICGTAQRAAKTPGLGASWELAQVVVAAVVGVAALLLSFFVALWPGEAWERALVAGIEKFTDRLTVHPTYSEKAANASLRPWAIGLGDCLHHGKQGWTWEYSPFDEAVSDYCDVGHGTLIPVAVAFSSRSKLRRSLDLSGETLLGAQLSSGELLATRRVGYSTSEKNIELAPILEKVARHRTDGRDFAFANFTGARLIRSDFSHAEISGANFSQADLAGAIIRFSQTSARLQPPSFDGGYLAASNVALRMIRPWSRFDLYAPESILQLQLVASPRSSSGLLKLHAPFSEIAIVSREVGEGVVSRTSGDDVAQRIASGHFPPAGWRVGDARDISGDVSFSKIKIIGVEIDISARVVGAQIVGGSTRLSFSPSGGSGGTNCRQYLDVSFAKILVTDENSNSADGSVDLDCVYAMATMIDSREYSVFGSSRRAQGGFLVLRSSRGRLKQGFLMNDEPESIPVLPYMLFDRRLFDFRDRSPDKTIFPSAEDTYVAPSRVCVRSKNPSLCVGEKLPVSAIREFAAAMCVRLHSDAQFVHFVEMNGPPEPLRYWLDEIARQSKTDYGVFFSTLHKCVEANKMPLQIRAMSIVNRLYWRGV